jgi:crossover junction endodeoxyribonuclease RuvC
MFRFGQQLGALEMAVAAKGHELRWVTPAKWKAHFGLVADKGVARGLAIQRFPQHAKLFARAKDDGRAEAALIALYGAHVMATEGAS